MPTKTPTRRIFWIKLVWGLYQYKIFYIHIYIYGARVLWKLHKICILALRDIKCIRTNKYTFYLVRYTGICNFVQTFDLSAENLNPSCSDATMLAWLWRWLFFWLCTEKTWFIARVWCEFLTQEDLWWFLSLCVCVVERASTWTTNRMCRVTSHVSHHIYLQEITSIYYTFYILHNIHNASAQHFYSVPILVYINTLSRCICICVSHTAKSALLVAFCGSIFW